jgi:hypothetical protein
MVPWIVRPWHAHTSMSPTSRASVRPPTSGQGPVSSVEEDAAGANRDGTTSSGATATGAFAGTTTTGAFAARPPHAERQASASAAEDLAHRPLFAEKVTMIERRKNRSENTWTSLENLFATRVPFGTAVLSDEQGLPIVASGIPDNEIERAAAELLRSHQASIVTGTGISLRLGTTGIDARGLEGLRTDVSRILAAV